MQNTTAALGNHLANLVSLMAADDALAAEGSAAEAAVVIDFVKTAPLPGVKVKRVARDHRGNITVTVTADRVDGPFPGTKVRSPQAKGSIAAIANSAPYRRVAVEIANA